MNDVAALTHAQFAENLNTKFRLYLDDSRSIELELVEVSELKESPRQERFALVFRGPLDSFFPQETYRIDHDQIGSYGLFLVPVGQEKDGFLYETVFNRVKERV